jgi:hypothetical protein
LGAVDPGATGSATPMPSGGGPSTSGGSVSAQGTHSWTPPANSIATVPEQSRSPGQVGGSGMATGVAPSNAVLGGSGPATGARVGAGHGADTGSVRQEGGQQPTRASGGGGPQGTPLGVMGAGQTPGEPDREHQRKYQLADVEDEADDAAPPVITSEGTK